MLYISFVKNKIYQIGHKDTSLKDIKALLGLFLSRAD